MNPWNANVYETVNAPHHEWAASILERAKIQPGEFVLDAGCGGGSVTRHLLEAGATVVAVDGDPGMVEKARESLPESVPVYHQDLLELELDEKFDVIFSCAVFHWITDHDRLFERLHSVLKPGGRLVAQCGGKGNIQNVLDVIGERPGRWLYADGDETEARLRNAGFSEARAWLEPWPVYPDDMVTFTETVILHEDPDRHEHAQRVAAETDHVNYVRLNIEAIT